MTARTFDIDYSINTTAGPLDAVVLWYTLDRGTVWQEYGADPDARPPMTFAAPQEGLYGFYIIAVNHTGPSSAPPNAGTAPHMWIFVDYTPPVVQFHPLRLTNHIDGQVLQIRWTAVDANFDSRPVMIEYQRGPNQAWTAITSTPLPNSGQYDWMIPEPLTGPMMLRVVVRDMGGHVVSSGYQTVDIPQTQHMLSPIHHAPRGAALGQYQYPQRLRQLDRPLHDSGAALPGSSRAKNRAARLTGEASALRDRGELQAGIVRMREAVRLNPQDAHSFAAMADMLYGVGDYDRSLEAYNLALQYEPTLRGALRGAAMAHGQKKDYASAANLLRTILRYNPKDAEVWMNLGDVAIYQGDEVLARECYVRATQANPAAAHIAIEARKRLEVMSNVSRRFSRQGF